MSSARLRRSTLAALLFCALVAQPQARAQDAAALAGRHAALAAALESNPFQRPLHLESREGGGELYGEVHARVAQPFSVAGPALRGLRNWCDILILHLNVKRCRAIESVTGDTLSLDIGRKVDQPLADTYRFDFSYRVEASRPDYLRVVLSAAHGPLGTRHYRILLEAIPLGAGHSFLHLSYAYAQGTAARWATQVYLATIGRSKVGFSIVGRTARGEPIYIGSTRGVIERNAMRCYLAIEAYLGSLALPAAEQDEQRLNDWFAAAERYPDQLHEIERGDYLRMKRMEIRRQALSLADAG